MTGIRMSVGRSAVLALGFTLLALVVGGVAGCASTNRAYHSVIMRGAVLEVTGDEVYLCIGSRDGAAVGQELTVVHFSKETSPSARTALGYRREKTGKVRITEVVDEHFARAKVIAGEAAAGSVVELEPEWARTSK